MTGKIVAVGADDSVRIEAEGGRVVQLPARLILAADRVLRHTLLTDGHLNIDMVEDDDTGEQGWQATTELPHSANDDPMDVLVSGICTTPWSAIFDLAKNLDRSEAGDRELFTDLEETDREE